MAHKTRTAQVLDIVKILAWVVIAVALVKFAFFPPFRRITAPMAWTRAAISGR